MKTMTLTEWRAEGAKRFGPNPENWAFVCPACGRINHVKEFTALGASQTAATQECLGCANGKGNDVNNFASAEHGCNWAAFGLLGTMDKGILVEISDDAVAQVFPFAPAVKH